MSKKVRIGIDVGGTFTDAVVIDNETYELIAKKKIPTTHKEGVAIGIVNIIIEILKENNISSEDVVFIAHGTTQATNALLEGDVAKVGIIGMGEGMEATTAKKETSIDPIELSPNKYLESVSTFINSKDVSDKVIKEKIHELKSKDIDVIVASEAYSVDDPTNELKVIEAAQNESFYATGGHEISELYGLKMRTRTAVINGSLIPKMMETANMTEKAVKDTKIKTELMIMRCDGGVMSIEEVRKRPILTMLSGLAAGVAGALMYEKISDGIFFEVGGTSVDITVIKNGKVMIKYAQVGGHKTYLQSLDVRTIGVAGGTMIKIKDNKISDVGPRSAHIAGVHYECFDEAKHMKSAKLKYIAPRDNDPKEYAIVEDQNGDEYSLTLCGAANLLGYIPEEDYASGNKETSYTAWEAVGKEIGKTAKEAAKEALDIGLGKLKDVVDDLIREYELDTNLITLVGGGGSGSVLVPALAEKYGMKWKNAKNAPYISTIGVALAMVREQIERSIASPTEEDVKKIRQDVIEKIVLSGAQEETVDVTIEIDSQKNIIRAIATGSTELRSRDLNVKVLSEEELKNISKEALSSDEVNKCHEASRWHLFESVSIKKSFFGLIKKRKNRICILDREGIVRFKRESVSHTTFNKANMESFYEFLDDNTMYSDANATIPSVFLFYKEKMLDLSGMQTLEQLRSIMDIEIDYLDQDEPVIAIAYL